MHNATPHAKMAGVWVCPGCQVKIPYDQRYEYGVKIYEMGVCGLCNNILNGHAYRPEKYPSFTSKYDYDEAKRRLPLVLSLLHAARCPKQQTIDQFIVTRRAT